MTRDPRDRFADMLAAIDRCMSYREHLADADPTIAEMAYDAVLRNWTAPAFVEAVTSGKVGAHGIEEAISC